MSHPNRGAPSNRGVNRGATSNRGVSRRGQPRGTTQMEADGAWLFEYLRTRSLLRRSIMHRQQNPGPPPSDDDFVDNPYGLEKTDAPASSTVVDPNPDDDFVPCTYAEKKTDAPTSSTLHDSDSDDDFVPCTYTSKKSV